MQPSKRTTNRSKHPRPMLPAPPITPLPTGRVKARREGRRVHQRGLYMGTFPDGGKIYLKPEHLRTHLHVIGPTGQGKSRFLLILFELLCHTQRPIVLIDPKGGLYRMARDFALTNGFQKRLVLFDLSGEGGMLPGYNPLRENGLRIDLQAQWVREGVKSAWGASTFDATPLLARMLYLCLYVARALRVSLMEALDILRPSPTLRHRALKEISDPFIHNALFAFDQLSDRLKSEQASSTISRLEMFLCDEIVRKVICSPRSIDLEQMLDKRKIILVNFGKYQPLLPDAVKLLGRMFFNDLLAHIYKGYGEGKFDEDNPCYVICDEVQNFATKQVCDALDEGRGIGCHMTIAHQHLAQLADEDLSGYLLHSVMADARTKILFGGMEYPDLEAFANNLLLDHFNPWMVKHIQRTPVFAPVESVRKVPTYSTSLAQSTSVTESFSESDSVSHSVEHSESQGHSIANSHSVSKGEHQSHTQGTNSSTTASQNWGTAESISESHTDGRADSQSRGRARSRSHGTTDSSGRSIASGRAEGESSTDSSGRSSASGNSQNSGTNATTSTGEGQVMLPVEERMFKFLEKEPTVLTTSTNTGSAEGRSSSAGSSHVEGFSSGHADSRMRTKNSVVGSSTAHATSDVSAESENEMESTSLSSADTRGRSSTRQEGFGLAHQTGTSEALSCGTDRSSTRGISITQSVQTTDGTSDSLGHTDTYGIAFSEGETHTQGTAITDSPFYEYRREEIETPTFMSVEEQRLLVMQRLKNIPKFHMLLKAPESKECIVPLPFIPKPTINARRLAVRLTAVYNEEPCYLPVAHHDQVTGDDAHTPMGDHGNAGGGSEDDVIDVEVREVSTPETLAALPSPASDTADEASLWQRWTKMGRGILKKS